ncbi:MAG: proline--tRNA ligase, partial [Bacilli bacterium]|nr:proline--tRNA ligase [Bacilli bacterium]
DKDKPKKLEKVKTPHCKTIEDVCNFLNVPVEKSVKALLMNVDDEFVCFFVRGDRDFNISKACKLLGVSEINFANDELIATSNACPGFTGPVGLNCKVVIDEEVKLMHNFVVGANEEDYHFINCNIDDIKYDVSGDISNVIEGDICPDCGGKLYFKKGIEIGNLFKLGTKYSEALGLTYLDKDNKANPVVMGSYGIGPARVISSVVEQNNDEHGIIFPVSIAPYSVCIVVTNIKDEDALNYAYSLEKELEEAGIDVLVDDRDERAGVKFNDMDLLGIPFRVTVGRAFKDGEVEFKLRRDSDSTNISTDKIVKTIKKAIEKDL